MSDGYLHRHKQLLDTIDVIYKKVVILSYDLSKGFMCILFAIGFRVKPFIIDMFYPQRHSSCSLKSVSKALNKLYKFEQLVKELKYVTITI